MNMTISDYSFKGLTKQIEEDCGFNKRAAQDTALFFLSKLPNHIYNHDWAQSCVYRYSEKKFVQSFYELIKGKHVPSNRILLTIAETLNTTGDYGIVFSRDDDDNKCIIIILLGYEPI